MRVGGQDYCYCAGDGYFQWVFPCRPDIDCSTLLTGVHSNHAAVVSSVFIAPRYLPANDTNLSAYTTQIDTSTICRVILAGTNNVQAAVAGVNGRTDDVVIAERDVFVNAGVSNAAQLVQGGSSSSNFNSAWVEGVYSGANVAVGNVLQAFGGPSWAAEGGVSAESVMQYYQGADYGGTLSFGEGGTFIGMDEGQSVSFAPASIAPGLAIDSFVSAEFQNVGGGLNSADTSGAVAMVRAVAAVALWGFRVAVFSTCVWWMVRMVRQLLETRPSTDPTGQAVLGVNANLPAKIINTAVWIGSVVAVVSYWVGFTGVFRGITLSLVQAGGLFLEGLGYWPEAVSCLRTVVRVCVSFLYIDRWFAAVLTGFTCCLSTVGIGLGLIFFREAVRV
jgi:hypothetical protein